MLRRLTREISFISIHAPREGSDRELPVLVQGFRQFQSTLPARGATYIITPPPAAQEISIHAPREGSDVFA